VVLGPVQVGRRLGLNAPGVAMADRLDLVVVVGRGGRVAELGVPPRELGA